MAVSRRRTSAALLLLHLLLSGGLAAPASAAKLNLTKQYEEELINWALKRSGLTRERAPEGKRIERIVIVREEIIAQSDPWPNFLNWFHIKTKEHIVRQELLVHPGEVWDPKRVAESARNLRKLFILAVVRTVPCRSSRPGHVVLLVVTKDLWSIRVNSIFSQVGTVLQTLDFYPTEHNFLGRNKSIGLHFRLRQLDWNEGVIRDHMVLGQTYEDPRLFGTRLRLVEQFDMLLAGDVPCGGASGANQSVWCPSQSEGAPEGVYGLLRLQRPLFSLETRWGFDAWATVQVQQVRSYRQNSGATIPRGEINGVSLRTDPYPGPGGITVPRIYDARIFSSRAGYTRSFGSAIKRDLSAGAGFYMRRFEHPSGMNYPDDVLRWHSDNYLPRSEDVVYLFGKLRTYQPRYQRKTNIQGFALSEDFALGHDVSLELRTAANLQRFSESHIVVDLSAQYTWALGDDLLAIWGTGTSRLQQGLRQLLGDSRDYDGPWANTLLEAGVRNVSPPLWVGRLHTRVLVRGRHNDLDRRRLFLGGNASLDASQVGFRRYEPVLRGYPSDRFEGDGLLSLNVEYRTLPLNLFTLHLGLVLFYDGGGVFGGPDPARPERQLDFKYHHSLGLGVRGHFPQFDKESLRIDFAVPLTDARGAPATWFSLSFKQTF